MSSNTEVKILVNNQWVDTQVSASEDEVKMARRLGTTEKIYGLEQAQVVRLQSEVENG